MSTPNANALKQHPMAPTTAQDLLNDVMSGRAIGGALSHLESSAPQPALLFGSELSHIQGQGQNIWSASREEQSLKFTSQPNQTYQARQFVGSVGSDTLQSMWSGPYSNGTPNPQPNVVGGLPSSPVYQPQISISNAHQRAPSTSMAASLHFSGPHPVHNDPFSYSSVPQQHIHDAHHGTASSAYMNSPLTQNNGSAMYHQTTHIPGYHSRHFSLHDPRLTQPLAPPSMWSNGG
jgi:hypothetical protein